MDRATRVSVSKRGTVTLNVLVEGVWHGVPLDDGEAAALADELAKADARARRSRA